MSRLTDPRIVEDLMAAPYRGHIPYGNCARFNLECSDEDLRFMAGLIEGQKSFELRVNNRSDGAVLTLAVKLRDERLARWCFTRFGGSVSEMSAEETWMWRVQGRPAEKVVAKLIPHFVTLSSVFKEALGFNVKPKTTIPPRQLRLRSKGASP